MWSIDAHQPIALGVLFCFIFRLRGFGYWVNGRLPYITNQVNLEMYLIANALTPTIQL